MPLPEPNFITLDYACNILNSHPEHMRFLIAEGYLQVYVASPAELLCNDGVKRNGPFFCRCDPPFKWIVKDEREWIKFSVLKVAGDDGHEYDAIPFKLTTDGDTVYRCHVVANGYLDEEELRHHDTMWFFSESDFFFKMSEIRTIIKEYTTGLPKDDKALKVAAPKETNENPDPVSAANFFTREGDLWHIGFMGQAARIKHLDGLLYIGYLLERPGSSKDSDLYQAVSGKTQGEAMPEGAAKDADLYADQGAQVIITAKDKQCIQEQWNELNDKLLSAGIEEREEIQEKINKLAPYVNTKIRNFADPNDKKLQSNITNRLKDAYAAIHNKGLKAMAAHLEKHITTDGAYGRYYNGSLPWVITL